MTLIVSRDSTELEKHAGTFDFILGTVSAQHGVGSYLNLFARDANLTLVGAPPQPLNVAAFSLITGPHTLSGSAIGIAETQDLHSVANTTSPPM